MGWKNRWKNKQQIFLMLAIIFIASFLRFYRLDNVPPALSLDEVSIAYNAYSILKTGADEYGYKFPLLLRAYDDWRPALYVYLVVPFVSLFGLLPITVRLPSAILSLVIVAVTFFLPRVIFKSGIRYANYEISSLWVGYLGAILLAISPWHVYLSRLGHEVNLGLANTIFGIFFFFLALKRRFSIYFFLSMLFFGLGLHSYQSQKLIIPLLLLALILLFGRDLLQMKKQLFFACLVFLLLSLIALSVSLNGEGSKRFYATSIFTQYHQSAESLQSYLQARESHDFLGQILFHPKIDFLKIIISQYFSHFNPKWLFTGGEKEDHKIPHLGLLYKWQLPFILLGMFFLLTSKIERRRKMFIFFWFFIAPLPAAITTQAPHAMRSYTFLPLWEIFAAIGFLGCVVLVGKRVLQYALFALLGFFLLISIVELSSKYFILFPRLHSQSFQYSLHKAIQYVISSEESYKSIIISNQDNLYQSYMFYLFWRRYDPKVYLSQGGTGSGGYAKTHQIGKISFRPINWQKEKRVKGRLFVGNVRDFPSSIAKRALFHNLNGDVGVVIVQ